MIDAARKLNENKRVTINAIVLAQPTPACEKALKQLVDENSGIYKFVGDEEIKGNR